jgi:mycothiol synthase
VTTIPTGYEMRPGAPDDVPALTRLEIAYDTVLYGRSYMEGWLEDDWARPRFDPSRDAWIVTSGGGEVVGYGMAFDKDPHAEVESIARVHPDHWGVGIGSALVDLIERRAREHLALAPAGSVRLLNDVAAADGPAHALLEARGYVIDRHFWHMFRELGEPLPPASSPPGITIRAFDRSSDERAVHGVLEESFRAHYGFSPTPFDEWREAFDRSTYDGGLWMVAEEQGRMVGILTGLTIGGEGWVGDVGVLAEQRGRGIGAALLLHSFHMFKARGFEVVGLNVDASNETGATALYERVGMAVRQQWDLYLKILTPDA